MKDIKPTYENIPNGVDDLAWKSIFLSDEEVERMRNLLKNVKSVQCFEYEGTIFRGDKTRAAMDFVHQTKYPSDFYVWLQDNYKIII
jgi:hypothetical protein